MLLSSLLVISCKGDGAGTSSQISNSSAVTPEVNNKMYSFNQNSGEIEFIIPQYEGKNFTYYSDSKCSGCNADTLAKLCTAIGATPKQLQYSEKKTSYYDQYMIHPYSDEIVFANPSNSSTDSFAYVEKLNCIFPSSYNYASIENRLNDASLGIHPYERLINYRYSLSSVNKDVLPTNYAGFLLLKVEEKGTGVIPTRLASICKYYVNSQADLKDMPKIYVIRYLQGEIRDGAKNLYDILDHSLQVQQTFKAYESFQYTDKIKCPQHSKAY